MTQTVHVVEDNPAAQMSLVALISALGFESVTYDSAESFLAQVDPNWRGCVITDVRLGGMSGMDLQREMVDRKLSLPVILITAYADAPLIEKALQQGAIRVLEKPCQANELKSTIDAAFAANAQPSSDHRAD